MKILLAVDGSKSSERAARHVVQLARQLAQPPRLTVLNVDLPLLKAAAAKMGTRAVAEYHASNADHALRHVRAVLSRAKLEFVAQTVIGEPAPAIAKAAEACDADLVVMGSRGMTALKNLLLGSVASKVLATSSVPVTLVR
ncbi:MAG TPA: universal stress protein [Luteimonas sp.]|nr:universal stress protein [Luteimonas sp.]